MKLNRYLSNFLLLSTLVTSICAEAGVQIRSEGSWIVSNIAQIWAENYQRLNPEVQITVIKTSSGAAIAGFINGKVQVINSSQPMREKEVKLAAKRGKNPTAHIVGYDALAIYVHKVNPIASLSVPELAQIFGENGKVSYWTDLAVEVPACKQQRLLLVGRHNTAGAHNVFRSAILGKQCYKWDIRSMLSTEAVVKQVANNPCAIGYGSHIYAREDIKMVCLSKDKEGSCINPTPDAIADKSYPISRPLYMYTDGKPKAEIKAYLDWILSSEGQCIALEEGFAPVQPVTCP